MSKKDRENKRLLAEKLLADAKARMQASRPTMGSGFFNLKSTILEGDKPKAWIMRGTVTLPGTGTVLLESTFLPGQTTHVVVVKELETWKRLGEFELPKFNGQPYVDAVIPVESRKFKARFIDQREFKRMLVKIPMAAKPADLGAFE